MAATRKTAAKTAKATDTMTEETKTTQEAPVAAAEPATEIKKTTRTIRKTAVKKEKDPAKKTTTRKTAAKKETAKKSAPAKEEAVQETLYLQFAGKSYATEDLVKIAKDVWQYDLNRQADDFKSVELYVKPEENVVYYVINGEVKGSFAI